MPASGTGTRGQDLARHVFDLITQFCLATPRNRRRAGDLKEIEFLTLTILGSHGTMIVGDIQRLLGVLPAQMSRIIRSLEDRDRPLIACRINPQDKRKIDVHLAFVVAIDLAGDQRRVAVCQGADDARHLRRQDTQDALNIADDHGVAVLEDGQGEELHLLDGIRVPAAAQGQGQRQVSEELEGTVGQLIERDRTISGDHGTLPLLVRPPRPQGCAEPLPSTLSRLT